MLFFQVLLSVLGRIALSSLFIMSGINHILNWKASEEMLVIALCDWHVHADGIPHACEAITFALDWVPVLLGVAVGLLLIGGLFVLLGFRARLGAFFLILFLVPASVIMHPFWTLIGNPRVVQQIAFTKNIAILGGLLLVLAFGSGIHRVRRLPPPPGEDKR